MPTFPQNLGPARRASAIAVALCFSGAALANPTGGTVVSGNATFATNGNTLSITNTPGAIINWQQFSIQKDEVTRFIQQNASSAVLNRITSQNPSVILGSLTSNGRVFLINPSGIAFGQSAVINVAGFTASTLNISDADFAAGRMRFAGNGTEGALTNAGKIITPDGGQVYLIAPKVENQATGVITSPKGEVVIAAGKTVELVNAQTPDIRVQYTAPDNEAVNAGQIVAASGRVGVYGTLIKNSGLVSASAATVGEGGKIVFKAVKDVTLEAGSRVESSGAKGGEIQVLGERVALLGDSNLDASGTTGGGTVLIGGDFQGKNPDIQNAQRTYVGSAVSIKADATEQGDGGKVVVWSDGDTRYYGNISARGGASSGNGGNVEVSGKQVLTFDGQVDASAANGAFGTLLLDPHNIIVAAAGGAILTGVDQFTDTPGVDSTIAAGTINAALANVVLQANNDITVNAAIAIPVAGRTLTMQAGRSILLNANVQTNNAAITLVANETLANGVQDANRDAGAAVITMTGSSLTAGTGNINITLSSGAGLTNSTAGAITLGTIASAGTVTVTNNGPVVANRLINLNGNVTSTGAQTYNQNVALQSGVTLAAGAAAVNFNGTVDGAQALTVNTTGTATFAGVVGGTTALTSLTTNAGGTTAINGTAVSTTGAQSYGDAVTLGADTTLSSSATGNIAFANTVNSIVANRALTVNTAGTTSFAGIVGGTLALTSLTTDSTGTAAINTTAVTTTGAQTYNDAVTLGANTTLTSSGNAAIGFGNTVNGAQTLTVNTTGATSFGGVVGGTTALTSVTTNAGGTTSLNGNVTTTGLQSFGDAVTLLADTTLASTGNLAITLAGTVNGAQALTVNTGGATTFGGIIGGTTALTSVTTDATGTTAINTTGITATGAQSYNDAVTLGAAATLASSGGGAITFGNTLNGGQALTVNTTGTTTFTGAVGATTALTSVTTNALGTTAINGGSVRTTGLQAYGDAVTLGAATTITSTTNQAVTFSGAVDGAQTLTVNTTGVTTFGGAVGGTSALTSLTTNAGGTTAINGGGVTTTGAQAYADAVTLGAATALTSTGSGAITFSSTVNGAQTLAVNTGGTTTFAGIVGGATPLTSITTDSAGTTAINTTTVTTTGAQTYNDAVTLGANAVLASTGNAAIGFGNTVNGAQTLTVNTTGATSFGGVVGGTTALTSVTTNAGGTTSLNGNVTTTGLQSFGDAVTLLADTTLASNGNLAITLAGTVNGAQALTVNTTGVTTFTGAVGGTTALTSLTTNTGGTTAINGGAVTTTGAQSYGDAVTLGADTTLTSSATGNIAFANTVNSSVANRALTVNTAGTTSFGGIVGATLALTSLTTDATGTTTLTGNVTTTTGQTYGDAVTLAANSTLTGTNPSFTTVNGGGFNLALNFSGTTVIDGANFTNIGNLSTGNGGATQLIGTITTAGSQTYADAVTLNGATTLASSGNQAITFSSTVNGAQTLAVNTGGTTTFAGIVGGTTALTSLTTDTGGTTAINTTAVTTTGTQTYNDAVTLGAAPTLASTGNAAIGFGSTVNGAQTLTVNTTGATSFGGVVGGTTALTSVTTNAGGTTSLNGNVTTTGLQSFGDAVTLNADSILASTGNAAITLAGTVNGAQALTVNTTGVTTFTGAVGGTTALTSLTTNTGGTTAINGGAVTTTGAQSYGDAVTLGADTTLTSTSTGNIAFANTVNSSGANRALTVNTAGTTSFAGIVGGTLALTSLTTNAGGTTSIAANITTTTTQSYGDAVTLTGNSTLAGTVPTFSSTVNGGGFNLALNFSGTTVIDGANFTNIGNLSTGNGGATQLIGTITTAGSQTYADAVTLNGATTLTSSGNQAITFSSTVNGAQTLAVNTGGTTTFTGIVGGATALTSLTTDAGGTTAINGGAVTTTGAQSYGDAVTLGANTTLASTTNQAISLSGTVDGARTLAINTTGATTFGGVVGGTTALTSVTTNAGGTTSINGNISTTGAQAYGDAVTLGADAILSSSGAGNVTFSGTVNGAQALTVNTTGVTTFTGAVGGTTALTSLTTNTGGTTAINGGGVNTTGAQSYGDAVTLGAATTLASTGNAAIGFASTVNGAQALTVNTNGATTFGGIVGGTTALTSLTTDAGGSTTLTGNVTTTGAQSYGDAVSLAAATTLASTTNQAITLSGTVDGAQALTVNTTGATTFGGAVGGTTALTSLTTNAGGTTAINGGVVTTTGAQSYGDAMALGANTTLTGTTPTFGSTVNAGGFDLALNFSGTTTIVGANFSNLNNLSSGNGGTTQVSGTILTAGSQTYSDAVTLTAATTFRSIANGNVSVTGAVNGTAGALTLQIGTGDATLTNAANDFSTVQVTSARNVSLADTNALTLGASTLSGSLIAVAAGDLTVSGVISASGGGDAITLSGGRFINTAGASALTTPGGRWLVWSSNANPFGGGTPDNRGGLVYDFKQYNATYGVTTVAGAANQKGFLYTLAPSVTPTTLSGSATKTYDGTVTAPTGSLTVTGTGAVDSDTLAFSVASATYDTRDFGTGKTVTATGITVSATNGGKTVYGYQVGAGSPAAAVGQIDKRSITVTAQTQTRAYDATTASSATPTIAGGLGTGDTATFSQTFDTKNVGSGKTLTAAGSVTDSNSGNNYQITFITDTTGQITPAALTITAQTNTKTYDGNTSAAATPTASGLFGADTVTGLSQAYANKNAGSGKTLSVTGYTVNDGNSGGNYTVSTVNDTTGVINQAALTITAQTNTKTYDGNTSSVATPTVSGLVGGDTVTGLSQAYANKNAGSGKTLSVSAYTVNDGNGGANYAAPTLINDTTGVINQAALTITAQTNTKTYDGNTTSAATPTVSGLVGGDTVTGLSQAYANKNAASGKTLSVTGYTVNDGNGGANYAAPTLVNDTTGVINQAALTITASTNTKTYDATTTSAAAPTVSGLQAGDTVTSLSQAYANQNAGAGKTLTVTGYAVNDGNGGANYAAPTLVNDTTGVINQAALTITAQTNTKTYDGNTSSAAAPTVAGLFGTDTVTGLSQAYTNKNAGAGKTLAVSGYTVNDGNAGGNYTVSTANDTTGVINQAALTITAQTNTKTYDGTTTAAAAPAVSGLQGTDTVTGLSQAYANKNAGSGKTLSVTAYTVNDGNAGGNYAMSTVNDTTGVINQAALTITASTNTKIYDATTTSAATPTASGVQAGDTVTGLTQAYTNQNAGSGKTLTVTGYTVNDGNGGANYAAPTLVNDPTGVINQRPITVTAQTDTKVYDGTISSTATPLLTSGSFVGGDTATYSQGFASKNAGTGKALNAAASITDGNGGNNYAVTYVADTTGVVTARPITVTATGIDKVYDATALATVAYADNRVAGDVLSASGAASFADQNVAIAKPVSVSSISLSGPDAPNYSLTSGVASTTANITAASLVIRPNNAARLAGQVNPPFHASYSGLQGADSPGVLSGSIVYNTPAGPSSPVGTYAINAAGLTSSNYSISYVPGVLAVLPLSGTLPDPLATAYGQMNALLQPGGPATWIMVSPVFVAQGEFESSRFLRPAPETAEAARRGEAYTSNCVTSTSISALRCAAIQ